MSPDLLEKVVNVCKTMYDVIETFGSRGVAETWLYEPVKGLASQQEFDLMVSLLVQSGTVKQENGVLYAARCMN